MGQILFVDDDTDSLAMYVRAVSLANHQADIASSVKEGWELIREKPYDLIFVDLNIPGVSGFELLKQLKKDRKTKTTNNTGKNDLAYSTTTGSAADTATLVR